MVINIPSNTDLSLDAILSKLDNAAFFAENGLHISEHGKRSGKNITADCPFCGEEKKFSLNAEKGLWQCFKCGETGNSVSFLAKMQNCSNGEAVKRIKASLGIETADPAPMVRKPATSQPGATSQAREDDSGETTPEGGEPDHPAGKPHPYERLIELAKLSDADRENLKVKRGFSDATIERFRFRSCGKYLKDVIEQLKQEFPLAVLLDSGILVDSNGTTIPNSNLWATGC